MQAVFCIYCVSRGDTQNSLKDRGVECICLLPVSNNLGEWYCLSLDTFRVVKRTIKPSDTASRIEVYSLSWYVTNNKTILTIVIIIIIIIYNYYYLKQWRKSLRKTWTCIKYDDNVKGALGNLDSFAITTPIATTVNTYLYNDIRIIVFLQLLYFYIRWS